MRLTPAAVHPSARGGGGEGGCGGRGRGAAARTPAAERPAVGASDSTAALQRSGLQGLAFAGPGVHVIDDGGGDFSLEDEGASFATGSTGSASEGSDSECECERAVP